MAKSRKNSIFKTNKRIKLGMWGLGRGFSFYKTCAALGIDVTAGCDYNEHLRERFLESNPGAYVSADEDEFLEHQAAMEYPQRLIDTARATTARIALAVESRHEPFGAVGETWMREAVSRSGLTGA